MEEMTYLAAQYLAAAGISFINKKSDDSHTNLGFSIPEGSLSTRPLCRAGDALSFNYDHFTLEWETFDRAITFQLDGSTHKEIVSWIEQTASAAGIEAPYRYDFHYDLPFSVTDDYTFTRSDASRLKELLDLRVLAQLVIESFVTTSQLDSEVRVWPHHFDTGAYAALEDGSGLTVGLGLAIPDSVCNDHYFYISAYNNDGIVSPDGFKALSQGTWKTESFTGAVLPATHIRELQAIAFFKEALATYKE